MKLLMLLAAVTASVGSREPDFAVWGTVTSRQTGEALADAVITLTNQTEGTEDVVVTDAHGRYSATLPPGRYLITSEKAGFIGGTVWWIASGPRVVFAPIQMSVDPETVVTVTLNCGG